MVKEASVNLPLEPLTAITTIDGRYRERTQSLVPYASEFSLIQVRMEIEGGYLVALSDIGAVRRFTSQERGTLLSMGPNLTVEQARRVKEIEDRTNHDVDALKLTMKELFRGTSLEDAAEGVHLAITSEDVNNLSYRTQIVRARDRVIVPAAYDVVDKLTDMADSYSGIPMLGRTHGQAAVPTTVGKELSTFATRLHKEIAMLRSQKLSGKLNGAVGGFNAHVYAMPQYNWLKFSKDFVTSLGFEPNAYTSQINPYEDIVKLFQNLKRINGIVVDLDQDLWRYISDDWFAQEVKKGETGSSTMTQKVNPIDFENSEGNAQIAMGLLDTLGTILATSRLQRDLSDSTVIRNHGLAMAFGLIAYRSTLRGLGKIYPNREKIREALNENWSILTEAVQITLRVEGEHEDAYAMVAERARGVKIRGEEEWKRWVDDLPIRTELKEKFRTLTPEKYAGLSRPLARSAVREIRNARKKAQNR